MLTRGYRGINDRTVSMVSDVMADFLKSQRQRPSELAAVMETRVDEAHHTGMTAVEFNAVVRRQFHQAAQGATQEQAARIEQARHQIACRLSDRLTELDQHTQRRQGLKHLEHALTQQLRSPRQGRGRGSIADKPAMAHTGENR